jgi:hypothetical protein
MAQKGQGQVQIFSIPLTSNKTTAQTMLGSMREEFDDSKGRRLYMYVQAGSALAKGDVVVMDDETGYGVAALTTSATRAQRKPMGVAIGTITSGSYGFIQVYGHCANIKVAHHACITAHVPMLVYASGKIRGKYGNMWSGSADISVEKSILGKVLVTDIQPFQSVSEQTTLAATSTSGFLRLGF